MLSRLILNLWVQMISGPQLPELVGPYSMFHCAVVPASRQPGQLHFTSLDLVLCPRLQFPVLTRLSWEGGGAFGMLGCPGLLTDQFNHNLREA